MITDHKIQLQISQALDSTNFPLEKYKGKVRDNYFKDDQIIMITSDRVSAFDVVLGTIPFKGQVLNQLALFWFEATKDIVQNHLIASPDPNVMVVKRVNPYPVEIIVRGYIAGSLWRDYEKNNFKYGITLDKDLKKNQKFMFPIITPTTKAEQGEHDMPISKQEIIAKSLVPVERYEEIERISIALFEKGSEIAVNNGLILVDTKYEFGEDEEGNLVLMDEIHTPDSSRFWYANEYNDRFDKGHDQNQLSKEHLREWLLEKGFSGEGEAPDMTNDIKIQVAKKYIEVFEQITGQKFEAEVGNVWTRIQENLRDYI